MIKSYSVKSRDVPLLQEARFYGIKDRIKNIKDFKGGSQR